MNEEKKDLTLEEKDLVKVTGGLKPEDVKVPSEIEDPDDRSGDELPRGKVIT